MKLTCTHTLHIEISLNIPHNLNTMYSKNILLDKSLFSQPASCSPCRWSVMAFRRSVLPCGLKNKTLPLSTRRKRAVSKMSVLLSEKRRRNSWRHTRKRRPACKVSVQGCALKMRLCCRNRTCLRRTLPGQCTKNNCQQLGFIPDFVFPTSQVDSVQQLCCTVYNTHSCLFNPSPVDLSVILFLVVCFPRMLSWAIVSKPWRHPSMSWRRDWWPWRFSTSRIAPTCKPSWMKQTAAARLCRERYILQLKCHL